MQFCYDFSAGHVLMPKMVYKGQKLTNEVKVNTAPNTNNTIPKVPVTVLLKYRKAKIAAIINLITLSAVPMFFFI